MLKKKNQCSAKRQEPFFSPSEPVDPGIEPQKPTSRRKTASCWALLTGEHTTTHAILLPKHLSQSQIRFLETTTDLQENQRTEGLVKLSHGDTTSKIQTGETSTKA